MKKKIFLLIVGIILLTGCSNSNKFYLDKKYYNQGDFISSTSKTIKDLEEQKESYIVYTYNYFCTFPTPCEDIFKNVFKKYKLDVYSLTYDEMKKTFISDTVKFAPSVVIINNGKIITYLDAESDADYEIYQDETKFDNWLNNYIYLT